jgi:hypothetical protein
MNVIDVIAPIDIEQLKLYFEDKTIQYKVNYSQSELKEEKFLTYLSNLDLPCQVTFDNIADYDKLLKVYLSFNMIVNIEALEKGVIDLLLQRLNIYEKVDNDLLLQIEDQLQHWTDRLMSLRLYNLYTIEEFKSQIEENEEDDTSDLTGVNFVNLLKYEELYSIYAIKDYPVKYYSKYFNEYMFKGKSLFSYWANENNPIFLITEAIGEGKFDMKEYMKLREQTLRQVA